MEIINNKTGKLVRLTTKPFWTSHAFESKGLVCVARASAEDAENWFSIDLTEDDLSRIKSHPDYAGLSINRHCGCIEDARPKTNVLGKVSSEAEQRGVYDALQNEGNNEPAREDRAPWQKSDDINN